MSNKDVLRSTQFCLHNYFTFLGKRERVDEKTGRAAKRFQVNIYQKIYLFFKRKFESKIPDLWQPVAIFQLPKSRTPDRRAQSQGKQGAHGISSSGTYAYFVT